MAIRIEVTSKVADARAEVRKKKLLSLGFVKKIQDVWIADVYTIDKSFSSKESALIASVLANPITQSVNIIHSNENSLTNSKIGRKLQSRTIKPSTPGQAHVGASALSTLHKKFTWAIEIGFLPGVTDNVAATAKETIEDLFKDRFRNGERVYTSQVTFIAAPPAAQSPTAPATPSPAAQSPVAPQATAPHTTTLSKSHIESIAKSLANPLIQRIHIKSYRQWLSDGGMDVVVPKVKLHHQPSFIEVDLNVSDNELQEVGKLGIQRPDGSRGGPLALDLTYMRAIQTYFHKQKRNPTDVELESLAQTWSEHCKHTIFHDPIDEIHEGLFKRYIRKATEEIRKKKGKKDVCVSVFTDNSGAVVFDETYLITHKVETHNSPSALDPFGGAITGIVGVNRDAIGFGLGAKPVVNTYGYCFANPKEKTVLYKDHAFTQAMLSPRRILDGVIDGVNAGGNCSGIPTPQGFVVFDARYQGKPLVFVGTVGLIPKQLPSGKKSYTKKAQAGDYIVMVGGRVGLDGIHGATFSSEALDSGSPATAVQIGDPITQKKLSDVLVKEARDLELFTSITDNGAGGLSCSVAEMAKEVGGFVVQLEKIPVKYPGLDPWQIWISESQERMTVAVPPSKWGKFSELMKRRGVEATAIGTFSKLKKCVVTYSGKKVMDLDMKFLHDGLPLRKMSSTFSLPSDTQQRIPVTKDLTALVLEMMSRPNIASVEFISQQYDHEVQAGVVLKPLQGKGRVNADATVIRPLLSSPKAVVLSQGLYPTYSDIDTYHMAAASIDTAVRNAVATGASLDNLVLLDNFCWCSPTEPERLGQLKRAVQACYDVAVAYGTPFISGKDSMFNDFKGYDKKGRSVKISIPPTVLISSLGVIDTVTDVVSLDAKFPGDLIYIIGETHEELGGSEYYSLWSDRLKKTLKKECFDTSVPKVDVVKNKVAYKKFSLCIKKGVVASATSVHRGGLLVALAKTSIGGMLGMEVGLKKVPGSWSRSDKALFSETQGRIVVTIAPQNKKTFEKIMNGTSIACIGRVVEDPLFLIKDRVGHTIVRTTVQEISEAYKKTFKKF